MHCSIVVVPCEITHVKMKLQLSDTVGASSTDMVYLHTLLIHDHAPEFLSDVSQDTAFILGIKQLPTSLRHPQYDGLTTH